MAVWILCACVGAVGAETRPLKLGLIAPASEPDAASLVHGAQLAIDMANAKGNAGVALEVRGETGQWGTVGNDAVALVCTRHVDGLITPTDGAASHLILQVSGRTRVPVASLCADSSVTAAGVPWAVRIVPRTDEQAVALFAAAQRARRAGLKWCAVIPADRAGRAIRHDLETAARRSNATIECVVSEPVGEEDAHALAVRIAAEHPDAVLIWLSPGRAGALASNLRACGFRGELAGPSSLDSPAFVGTAGAESEGMWIAAFPVDALAAEARKTFVQRYRRAFGSEPDATAAAAYDAARVLIEALQTRDAAGRLRAFPSTEVFAGVTGAMRFDPLGNRLGALEILSCVSGRFAAREAKAGAASTSAIQDQVSDSRTDEQGTTREPLASISAHRQAPPASRGSERAGACGTAGPDPAVNTSAETADPYHG